MIIAPTARRVESAGPDAALLALRFGLFAAIGTRGNGEPFGNQDGPQVAITDGAAGQQAIVLITALGSAIDRVAREQARHPVAGGPATGPGLAGGIGAVLGQFGRIKAKQAHTVLTKPETVSIAGTRKAADRRRKRVQSGRSHRDNGQHGDAQNRPARALERSIV